MPFTLQIDGSFTLHISKVSSYLASQLHWTLLTASVSSNFLSLNFCSEPSLWWVDLVLVSTSVSACDGKNNLETKADWRKGQLDHFPGHRSFAGQISWEWIGNMEPVYLETLYNTSHNWQNVNWALSHPSTKCLWVGVKKKKKKSLASNCLDELHISVSCFGKSCQLRLKTNSVSVWCSVCYWFISLSKYKHFMSPPKKSLIQKITKDNWREGQNHRKMRISFFCFCFFFFLKHIHHLLTMGANDQKKLFLNITCIKKK